MSSRRCSKSARSISATCSAAGACSLAPTARTPTVSRIWSRTRTASRLSTRPILSKAELRAGPRAPAPAGAGRAASRRAQHVATHHQRGGLGQCQLHRQPERELFLELPERAPAIALVVVQREPRLLERAEGAPDRPDGGARLLRGVLHRDARRTLDHLQQPPLPGELVPARHGKIMTRGTP